MSKRKRASDSIDRVSVVVSYGLLLYQQHDDDASSIRFLLGLIPQRNWWTVFKGLPEGPDESPHETAMREFREETGVSDQVASLLFGGPSTNACAFEPETTLHAKVGSSKDLCIFLVNGSRIQEADFNMDRVAKIDQGYMQGRPEIVAMRWLSLEQALQGVEGAKIYKSQVQLLQQANQFLLDKAEIDRRED
jgi:8-oxo-dGTP pyrophosphatase MutT (NUDIX family)